MSSVLIRFVARNGALLADEARQLPGRGAWLHPVSACAQRAITRNAFARALKTQVNVAITDLEAITESG